MNETDKNITKELQSIKKSINALIATVVIGNIAVALVIISNPSISEFIAYAASGAGILLAIKALQYLSGKLDFWFEKKTTESEPEHAPVQDNRGEL